MRLPQFEYFAPTSLSEALSWLKENRRDDLKILAGGTDLLVDLRDKVIPDGHRPRCQQHRSGQWQARSSGREKVGFLLALSRIPELKGITEENDRIRIGALTTIRELENSVLVRNSLHALWDGAMQLGSPLVRNRGTFGGNLCNARPAADTAIPSLSLNARLVLESPQGTREIDQDQFVTAPGVSILRKDEILKEIVFDKTADLRTSAYIKLANRKALEISVVGAAATVIFEEDFKTVKAARITLGAVAPKPLLVPETGDSLNDRNLNKKSIEEAARIAAAKARPITDHRGNADYRKTMIDILVQRVLSQCAIQAEQVNSGNVLP